MYCEIFYLWLPSLLAVVASTFRSFNWGYQRESYVLSALAQIPFIYREIQLRSISMVMLNTFYLIGALIGVYRWWNDEVEKIKIPK